MAFVTVEDYSSSIEMLVFPKTLQKYGYLLTYDSAIAVSGTLSIREEEDVKLLCDEIIPLVSDGEYDANRSLSLNQKPHLRREQ